MIEQEEAESGKKAASQPSIESKKTYDDGSENESSPEEEIVVTDEQAQVAVEESSES